MDSPILHDGENCWCRPRARRAAVLIDGAHYFDALATAIERAERSIVMLGWDFHSRVRLRRGGSDDSGDFELLALLERQVRRRRGLRVRILAWDFAVIYALEREWQPLLRFDWSTHRRVSFRLDDAHPLGASQHQKIVVIDDALAFSGGLDVTVCRWDTREHQRLDPRRNDPGYEGYDPFHDVQMAVDGNAALALAELARERWKLATGRTLKPVRGAFDPWPPELVPDFRDVDVGISRTLPAHEGRPQVREVEKLYVDSLRAARRLIYLENQYFTAERVGELLEERLSEPDGPEVVVVLPSSLSGWLEEKTMGVLAARLIQRLRAADRHGRLRMLQPRLPEGGTLCVHAKLTIIDDRLLRVGSANTSNRSMGFDSECDLAIESTRERDVSREIRGVRDDLLAEHLGCSAEEVGRAVERHGSVVAAIDELSSGERRLEPIPEPDPGWIGQILPERTPFDPERPIAFEELWPQFTLGREAESQPPIRGRGMLRVGLGVAAVLGIAVVWQATPLRDALDPEMLAERVGALAHMPFGAPLAVLLFAAAATLLVPVTGLTAASGMVFGFGKGAAIALAGSALGAGVGYAIGHSLWRDAVRRLAGRRLGRISRTLGSRGVLAAAAVRLVPVAPFGIVNMVAGASHIRARHFMAGTVLGMAPGAAALAYFGERAWAVLRDPGLESIALAAIGLALLVALSLVARRLSERFSAESADS